MGWWGSHQLDTELQNILARATGRPPELWGREADHCHFTHLPSISAQASILADSGPWSMFLRFFEETEDGRLVLEIGSAPSCAWAYVTVGDKTEVPLTRLRYVRSDRAWLWADGTHREVEHVTKSRVAVDHIRQWVRGSALPQLETLKARRDALEQEAAAKQEAMRRKYM